MVEARGARKAVKRGRRLENRIDDLKPGQRPNLRAHLRERLEAANQRALTRTAARSEYGQQIREKRRIVTPATPGTRTPTIQPFMKSDDMMALQEARSKMADTIANLDYDLDTEASENEYERSEIDRSAIMGRSSVNDDMASRGLFNSSVRDAELYDIDATAGIRKNFLDRTFDTLMMDTQRRKLAAQSALTEFQHSMNQKMIENAREASEGMEEWLVKPTEETTEKIDIPKVKKPGKYLDDDNYGPKGGGGKKDKTPNRRRFQGGAV